MTCREAVDEVFRSEPGVLTTRDVINRINAKYPAKPWKDVSISCHLMGMSINHPSRHYYPHLNKFAILYSLGNGRYRRTRPGDTAASTNEGDQVDDEVETIEDTEPQPDDSAEDLVGAAVSLERDLEQFLSMNLGALEEGLAMYTEAGLSGRQVSASGAGEIDLLATDRDANLVVIELKAGTAQDQVCGQLLRYMGWVQKHLAHGRRVRGIVVANDFTEKMQYAALAMPSIKLIRYRVSFQFGPVTQV